MFCHKLRSCFICIEIADALGTRSFTQVRRRPRLLQPANYIIQHAGTTAYPDKLWCGLETAPP